MIFLGKLYFAFASTPRADFSVILNFLKNVQKNFRKDQRLGILRIDFYIFGNIDVDKCLGTLFQKRKDITIIKTNH